MVIFMTGGTGNIGQYVTLELLKRGHKIKLLSRTPDRIKAFSQMENVELIGGTILDKDIIKKALQGERMPSPTLTSLEFIRNFARNFRVCKGENGIVQDFVLN